MFVLDETPRSRKRQRETLESLPKDCPEDPPTAKRKHTSAADTYRWHRPASFWDRLSKVHLSRGALREFDRRTSRGAQLGLTPRSSTLSRPTTKSVKRFSRHGGPDLNYIRGFAVLADQDEKMSQTNLSRKRSPASGVSGKTGQTSKSSYDPNFEQNLMDGGIYPEGYEPDDTHPLIEPGNMHDIQTAMSAPRASLSPSRFTPHDFQEFRRKVRRVGDEATARAEIISIIAGDSRTNHYSAADRQFNHLQPLADGLPKPVPDLYDGAYPQQIDRRIRRNLGKAVIPCNNASLPAAPNFFLEGKSASGRADVAMRQVCHDGAIGARAMHHLQNYQVAAPYQVANPVYDGNGHSYSATYHHGTKSLQLYTHYVTAPKGSGDPPEYHMSQLKSYSMYSDIDTFRAGAGALRNNRDRAKTDRDKLIDHANQIVRGAPFADAAPSTTLTDERTSLSMLQEDESDTSTDEISAVQTTAKRTRHAPVEKSRSGTANSYSTRPLIREPTISRQSTTGTQYVQSGTHSRPRNEDGKSRRQIRPTRKIMENTFA